MNRKTKINNIVRVLIELESNKRRRITKTKTKITNPFGDEMSSLKARSNALSKERNDHNQKRILIKYYTKLGKSLQQQQKKKKTFFD